MVDVSVQAFGEYLQGVKSSGTTKKYVPAVERFLQVMQLNGVEKFSSLPPGLLNEYAAMLSGEGKSPSTVRVYVFGVKKYLDWVRDRGVKVAHQARLDLPKVQLQVRPVLPPSKMTDFFRYADMELEEPVRTAVMLLPCCGLRASEIVALRLSNIGMTRVRMKNGAYKKTLYFSLKGKGGKERNVPLMEEGVEILTGYLAGYRKRRPGEWLFPTEGNKHKLSAGKKKHISDRYLRLGVERIRDLLGMQLTPQTFRRTYATTLHRKGVDIKVISDVIGHTNIQTTFNHYIKMDPQQNIDAVHKAGASLMEK